MNKWRTGNRLGRTIYYNDECIGMVDTKELANRIVAALNFTESLFPQSNSYGGLVGKTGQTDDE